MRENWNVSFAILFTRQNECSQIDFIYTRVLLKCVGRMFLYVQLQITLIFRLRIRVCPYRKSGENIKSAIGDIRQLRAIATRASSRVTTLPGILPVTIHANTLSLSSSCRLLLADLFNATINPLPLQRCSFSSGSIKKEEESRGK